MKPLTILLVHYSASPIIGGVESVLGRHAQLMAAAGHSVRILAARGEKTSPAVEFTRIPLVDSLHPDILRMKQELDAGRVPSDFRDLSDRLADTLRAAANGADILIAHNICSLNKNLALADALHRLYREPGFPHLIIWHHDLAWSTPRYQPELHPGRPWDLLRDRWPGAVHVTISDLRRREVAELTGLPSDSIRNIPNGIVVEEFLKLDPQTIRIAEKHGLLQCDPFLLLPVRITPRKNLELALHMLAQLKKEFSSAALLVTGPVGPHNPDNEKYFDSLLQLRRTLELDATVHFLAEDGQPPPDVVVADLYRLADALFLPSREEGFGLPLLEAGLTRCPIYCADLPALRELGSENVFFFSPDESPANLAECISSRMKSDSVHRMATRVRREYDWNRIYRERIEPLLVSSAGTRTEQGDGL
jgi:glycosyltransferase involved in cell wall biosynthesis